MRWAAGALRGETDAVSGLGMVVSNPPTQAEVQALADKYDELLAVLKGP